MSQPIIIGFGNKARQGKDTAARLIHEAFPHETKIYSFAAALRAVCRIVLGMREKDGPLLQIVGTEVFRMERGVERDRKLAQFLRANPHINDYKFWNLADLVTVDQDVWVRAVQDLIKEDQPRVALITDMRFPNEVAVMDATIKVTRWLHDGDQPGYTPRPARTVFVAPDRPADHPSETALDDYDNWTAQIGAYDGEIGDLRDEALGAYEHVINLINERRNA